MTDIVFGLKLTADGKEIVGAAKESSAAIDSLAASAKKAQSEAEKLNATQSTLATTLNTASQNAEEFNGQSSRLVDEYKQLTSSSDAWSAAQQRSSEELARSEAALARNAAVTAEYKARIAETTLANSASSAEITKLLDRYDTQGAKLRTLTADFNKLMAAADTGGVGGRDEARLALAYTALRKEMAAAGAASGEAATAAIGHAAATEVDTVAVKVNSTAVRESLVLVREASVGNFTRMAGSASIMANALGILPALFTPVGMGIAALAVATVGWAYAVEKGRLEQEAMDDALIMTGNYAGATSGSLDTLAHSAAAAGGSLGEAKKAVIELAASGKYTSEQIGAISTAAVAMERATGVSVDATIKQFESLAVQSTGSSVRSSDAISSATLKLDDRYHFLTLAVYEQISALEKEGDAQGASKLATDEYSKAVKDRAAEILANLGTIEKGWNAIKDSINGAISAVGDFGKTGPKYDVARASQALSNFDIAHNNSGDMQQVAYQKERIKLVNDLTAAKSALVQVDVAAAKQSASTIATSEAEHAAKQIDLTMTQLQKKSQGELTTALKEYHAELAKVIAVNPNDIRASSSSVSAAEAAIKKAYTPKATHITDHVNAAYIAALKEATNLKEAAIGKTNDLTQAEVKLNEIEAAYVDVNGRQVKLWDVLSSGKKLEIEQYFAAASAVEKETAAHLADQKARDDAIKTMDSETARITKNTESAMLQTQEIGKTKAQIDLIKAARYDHVTAIEEERLATIDATGVCTAESEALRENIKAREAYKSAMDDQAARQATQVSIDLEKKANVDMWNSIEQTAHSTWTNVFLGGQNAFQKIGATLKASILDMLYQITIKQWFVSITASVASGAASAAGETLGAAASSSGGTGVGSWVSAGKSIYDAINGGFTAIATSVTDAVQGAALLTATSTSNTAIQSAATSIGNAAGAIGTAASYIGAGMAGITVGSMIAGDKKVLGMDGTTTSGIGAVLGSIIGGPLGGLIGGGLGGIFDAAFGSGPKVSGTTTLAGNFSQQGFSGQYQTPWHQDGGWFSSDSNGVDVQGVGVAQSAALQATVAGTKSVFDNLIAASGEANKSLTGWTFSINRQVATQDQQTQLVTDIARSMGNFMIPSLAQFGKTGETLADTAVRMHDEFVLTNSIATLMGKDISTAFGSVGLASMGMRDNLVTLMGGITQTNTTMQSYYTNYLTSAEQSKIQLNALSVQFQALGVAMPTTRDGFRALVTAQDLSTQSGQQLYASLMSLNGAFAAAVPAAAAANSAAIANERAGLQTQLDNLTMTSAQLLDKQRSALDASNQALFDNIQAVTAQQAADAAAATKAAGILTERQGLQTQLDNLTMTSAQLLDKQRSALDASNQALFDQIQAITAQKAALTTAQSNLDTAYQRESAMLQTAIKSAQSFAASIHQLADSLLVGSTSALTSNQQYIVAQQQFDALMSRLHGGDTTGQGQLSGSVATLLSDAKNQSATALDYARTFVNVQNQVDALGTVADQQVTTAQEQLDALNASVNGLVTVNSSVLSVTDAVIALHAAMAAVGTAQALPQVAKAKNANGDTGLTVAQSYMKGIFGYAIGDLAAGAVAGITSQINNSNGLSGISLMASIARNAAANGPPSISHAAQVWEAANGVAVTPINGSHASGLDYVPFDGYLAELHQGERVQTKAQAQSSDATAAEISSLRAENATAQAAIASLLAQLVTMSNRWEGNGIPIRSDATTPVVVHSV